MPTLTLPSFFGKTLNKIDIRLFFLKIKTTNIIAKIKALLNTFKRNVKNLK